MTMYRSGSGSGTVCGSGSMNKVEAIISPLSMVIISALVCRSGRGSYAGHVHQRSSRRQKER
jgi:hypothetical protein